MDHRKLFGKRVRRLRKAANLTLEAASQRSRVSANYWGEVERSTKVPSLDTIVAMSKALNVPAHVLLYLEREEDPKSLRKKLEGLLDKCSPEQLELVHRVTKVLVEP